MSSKISTTVIEVRGREATPALSCLPPQIDMYYHTIAAGEGGRDLTHTVWGKG